MTAETILTAEQKDEFVTNIIEYGTDFVAPLYATVDAIEQAVLQSPEMQAWKRDAERYRFIRDASCDENEPLLNKAASEIRSRIPKDRIAPRYEDYDAGIDAAMEQQK